MDLFSQFDHVDKNYLPKGGIVNYYRNMIPHDKATNYLKQLLESIQWENDTYHIAGKKITTNRKIAWYGNTSFELNYSKTKKKGYLWTKVLLELKVEIERITNETFNSCLLNLYHTGEDSLGWHSDSEKGAVASLSLGAARKFVFKNKSTKEKVDFNLSNGDLLVMKGDTQENWLHTVPRTKKVSTPRINLTFRTINY
ncbi:Alkylated DNA repair dioxygenase AlkB [Aquimarina amphilecti]|uniref:Alkylated DNA repair dioxygenase AlkB n=1 Tax=Aquimarina amphilecti TaxID=1038014 RepID=A0A1H7H7I6_AQUAM|nr:alpha-ketoglutarate-dependent dioxygenase AlkB [Aquimarina amphilecti]SEK46219.1 Alkylated DNA repair dioxygenase AlkB [Aquimarina amphilecti]